MTKNRKAPYNRKRSNYIGAYVSDEVKRRLDLIQKSESERFGARLKRNQVIEILINRFPLEPQQRENGNEPR